MSSRWIGSWLAGPESVNDAPASTYPGERYGFPRQGPGSMAGIGRRVAQLLIDIALSWLVADLFAPRYTGGVRTPNPWASVAVFAVECIVLLLLGGQTAGMRFMHLRVVRLDGRPIGPLAAVARTVLTLLLVPLLFIDRDLRGLHDRAVGSAVVRTRA